ncbi:MAG TPA: MaoC/PaaZ C-terminal domain-containing protein [Jatrophihabitans sp.]|jgi:hypothetical protein
MTELNTELKTELTSAPALGPLFARAVLSGPRRRADSTLQDSRLTLVPQPVDSDRLRRYQQVCGFRVSDVLPATYLHLMTFPLSVARMTQADFPFPLLGLVHVQNVISQVRPVGLDEQVGIDVWADNLRPHHAGHQVDLVSEARVAGEVVWSETCTYLRRGGGKTSGGAPARTPGGAPGRMPDSSPAGARDEAPDEVPDEAPEAMPISAPDAVPISAPDDKPISAPGKPAPGGFAQWRVPADTGRRYAAVSGDRNPIHLHGLTAKAFGFKGAIAHGMWLKARTLAAFEGRLADAFTVDVSFKTPVFLPATVQMSSTQQDEQWVFEVHDPRSGRPHLTGEIRLGDS